MKNITIRNIPDNIMESIRILSEKERRSINNEVLIILENGLKQVERQKIEGAGKQVQVRLWEYLCGKWEDADDTKAITDEIYRKRTPGRDIEL